MQSVGGVPFFVASVSFRVDLFSRSSLLGGDKVASKYSEFGRGLIF